MAARSAGEPGPGGHHFGRPDPRDNPLVLLQTGLGLLLVLGVATRPAAALLAGALAAEALLFWGFWGPAPNIMHR